MAKDDTDVLKSIIAKSTNITAIAAAKLELSALQERKASLSAAIKPVLDVPQIVTDPTTSSVFEKGGKSYKPSDDDNVTKNIKKMREDIDTLSAESVKSRKILESILKTNEKYYESNAELINRLMISSGLTQEKLEALMKKIAAGGVGSSGEGAISPQTGQDEGGLGGLGALGALGYGALRLIGGAGRLITKPFRRTPKPDVDAPKPKGNVDPDFEAKKKVNKIRKGRGKNALITAGLLALGWTAIEILGFLDGDDEYKAKKINELLGYVPDWMEDFVREKPDLAVLLGIQVPELAVDATRAASQLAGQTSTVVRGTTEAFKGYAEIYKGFTPKAAATVGAAAGSARTEAELLSEAAEAWTSGTSTAGSMTADVAENAKEIQKLSRLKTGFKATGQVLKVTKDTIGKAVTKIVGESLSAAGIKGLPAVGLGLSGIMAGLRAWEGDWQGAGLEIGAGGLSLFPGLGTAGSVGVNAYLIARDVYKSLYGVFPNQETDAALRDQRWNELYTMTQDYVTEQINELTAKGIGIVDSIMPQSSIGQMTPQPFNNPRGAGARTNPAPAVSDTNSSSSPYNGEWTPEEAQRSLMGSRASPRTREGIGVKLPAPSPAPAPAPVDTKAQQKLNVINAPTNNQPNVVVNRQGDTINNVNNNNSAGGGGAGASGSPTKVPSPFDHLLYGDVFNWGY